MFFPLRIVIATAVMSLAAQAHASVGNPKSSGVTKGEVSLQYKGARTGDDRPTRNNAQKNEFEAYYGLTDRLKLGLEYIVENPAGPKGAENTVNIVNATYNTTTQGDWWLSSAVFVGYGFGRDRNADDLDLVLIGEHKHGDFNYRGNFSMKREVGANRNAGVAYGTAFQVKYDWKQAISPALEWHADYGSFHDTLSVRDQEHYVGPYLSGRLFETAMGAVYYGAGYYWGLTSGSADNAQRVLLEYEYSF